MADLKPGWHRQTSPFHEGEKILQKRAGKGDEIERIARRAFSEVMPDQHRAFYRDLPFVIVGHADDAGRPWSSMLCGRPGFMTSPDPATLELSTIPHRGDPLADSLSVGRALGLLGLDFATRRRNRLNARITETGQGSATLKVDQAFGNCPQYIQTRAFEFVREPGAGAEAAPEIFESLDGESTALISAADTFFVSSYVAAGRDARIEGVDASHRGGRPGFVRVEGDTLTVTDFRGNNYFNTLGNFFLNPQAGLLFADFENGDLLMLTGTVEIIWDGPEVAAFDGADRAWRFALSQGRRLRDALPLRWSFGAQPAIGDVQP